MTVKKEQLVILPKPDITQEVDDIAEAREEIKKHMAIIEEKEERIKLKKEQDLRNVQESHLLIARKNLEQVIEQVNFFKNAVPFNKNMTFMQRLVIFYDFLDNYQKAECYQTEDYLLYGQEREFIRRVRKTALTALDTLGDQRYRELLRSFTGQFDKMNKQIEKLSKKVNKL